LKTEEALKELETGLRKLLEDPLKEISYSPEDLETVIKSILARAGAEYKLLDIEVVPLKETTAIRPRNQYTSTLIGGLPMFCSECGRFRKIIPHKEDGKIKSMDYLQCYHRGDGI
jgi:hypothetical protein